MTTPTPPSITRRGGRGTRESTITGIRRRTATIIQMIATVNNRCYITIVIFIEILLV